MNRKPAARMMMIPSTRRGPVSGGMPVGSGQLHQSPVRLGHSIGPSHLGVGEGMSVIRS